MDGHGEEEHSQRPRWLFVLLGAIPLLVILAFAIGFVVVSRDGANEKTLVDEVSTAGLACVLSVRGDAPESWGLENALEHMSRMERSTRDASAPPADRARFAQLSIDAARGCEALGTVTARARAEAPDLYFAVPAKLAQPPDQREPERWFRRVLPKSLREATELARQIRAMNDAINARRAEHELTPILLPIEGGQAAALARIVTLSPIPADRERPITEVWPLDTHIVALRRGSIPAVPCDTRHVNRASCYRDFVQTISWTGELGAQREIVRPARATFWASFAPTPDGSLWAVGIDTQNRGIVGRYDLATDGPPEIASIAAPIDGASTIASVIGGVAVTAGDGTEWVAQSGTMAFARADAAPARVVIESDPSSGVNVDGLGALSISGSDAEGYTARLSADGTELLQRIIDAHSRFDALPSLRALRSGRAVLLLQRDGEHAPDALALTTDLGRTWLAGSQ
jgi:hypothetical protein